MSDLGIYVFSGTGNTLKCAQALRDALAELDVTAGLYRVEDGNEPLQETDLVLCYPVHGFNAPNVVLRFCRGLKSGNGNVWYLKTSGEPLRLNDNSSAQMTRILEKKGYHVRGEFHYIMPYNMVFRHSDEVASLMWETARKRIPSAAAQIAQGTGTKASPGLPAKVMSGMCRIEHWFFPRNGRLFRVDADRCTKCMKCVKNCPVQNIRYEDGRFRFGKNCTECARCSFECPNGAIHIGMLDFMRVNGPYDFTRDPGEAVLGKFCRKAYERYFADRNEGKNTHESHGKARRVMEDAACEEKQRREG